MGSCPWESRSSCLADRVFRQLPAPRASHPAWQGSHRWRVTSQCGGCSERRRASLITTKAQVGSASLIAVRSTCVAGLHTTLETLFQEALLSCILFQVRRRAATFYSPPVFRGCLIWGQLNGRGGLEDVFSAACQSADNRTAGTLSDTHATCRSSRVSPLARTTRFIEVERLHA